MRHSDGTIEANARVWAPDRHSVELVIDGDAHAGVRLHDEGNGYFAGAIAGVGSGTRYRFRLDGGEAFPDPVSRYQPSGPHGWSTIVDSSTYEWSDTAWKGATIDNQVFYELHVGTFTTAGTYRAAIDKLPDLVDIGITMIEVMPIAEFPGRFGWGYDGVSLFAPSHLYGAPDDLRAFVDAAHGLKLAVILDVVYNHLGPDGNYLTKYAKRYFSDQSTDWGEALNFDGADAAPVREFFLANARYWIEEFHLDGLRLDATQQIYDTSPSHILAEITGAVRRAAGGRHSIVVAENEPQDSALLKFSGDGHALDALWNDDFHHSVQVAATGRSEAYYSGYRGSAQELLSAAKYGFLYQGEWYAWQKGGRGHPALDLDPRRLINFTQNHDQVANTIAGRRMPQETSPGRDRALTALLLLSPQTPMLFQGQEFASSSPFLYFADHAADLATMVGKGRKTFLEQFPSIATPEGMARVDDPADTRTFLRSKLDWSERRSHTEAVALHRDLLRLRREDAVLRAPRARGVDGAVIDDHAFLLRYFGGEYGDRLLFLNLGGRRQVDPFPEPLLAPPVGARWRVAFSTDDPRYGGWGTPSILTERDGLWLPAECAAFLISEPCP